jgi:hypothetical protein
MNWICDRACRVETDLARIEKQIYDLESNYLDETAGSNLVRGWANFSKQVLLLASLARSLRVLIWPCRSLQAKKVTGSALADDRVFSLSSVTSPLKERPWPESLRSVAASTGMPTAPLPPHAPSSSAPSSASQR